MGREIGKNEICCKEDNHSYMGNICAKEVSNSSFNEAVIDKISIFKKLP